MCAINGTCGCGRSGFGAALSGALAWWLLRTLARAVRLAAIALVAAAVWAAPRVWRGALAATDAVERVGVRWRDRRLAVVVDERPVATALTDRPHGDVRWSDLIKESTR
jgi:hypothetical protein